MPALLIVGLVTLVLFVNRQTHPLPALLIVGLVTLVLFVFS